MNQKIPRLGLKSAMTMASCRTLSALLDLVALRRAEAFVARRGEGLADVWGEFRVASAHWPGVGHARGGESTARGHLATTAEKKDRHLHPRAADLHLGLLGI